MCRDCGCSEANERVRHLWTTPKPRELRGTMQFLSLPVVPAPEPEPGPVTRTLTLEHRVLEKNDRLAAENRSWFSSSGVRAINMMSSPGAGKTRLLEKTVQLLGNNDRISILTGDQEQDYDAQRLLSKGAHVKQLNTLSSCHLDAEMIHGELGNFVKAGETDLLIIENVGNLVCPASFDLGESRKVALLSTTEGEDKPGKYPLLFHSADLIIITKIDLIPHLEWDEGVCVSHIRNVNSRAKIIKLSAKTGEGMPSWLDYLSSPS